MKRWVAAFPSDGSLVPPPGSNPATYYYYDGWNLIQEGSSASDAQRQYVHGARVDEVPAQITPPNDWIRYFHYDASGHCTLQTDAFGNIVEQYEYDAFGYPYFYDGNGSAMTVNGQPGSAWGNRFLFTGREYISELKLYDYRNRLYQPELGRFMQPDPKEFGAGDYNLYRYCHNDPVNKSDPTGLYLTYSDNWSESDAEIFKQAFEQWWNDPGQRSQLEQMYNSQDEYRVYPDRRTGTPDQGATGFGFVKNPQLQQPQGWFQQLSDAIRNIPNVIGMGESNQNYERKAQGDNTAANQRAEAAANKVGLNDTQRELFHDAIHGRNLTFKQMEDEARIIQSTYPKGGK